MLSSKNKFKKLGAYHDLFNYVKKEKRKTSRTTNTLLIHLIYSYTQ